MKAIEHKEQEEFTLKEKILYTGGSILVAIGTFFLGRKIVRSAISNREERKTFNEDSPATYAKRNEYGRTENHTQGNSKQAFHDTGC
jgi:hypothetical protein